MDHFVNKKAPADFSAGAFLSLRGAIRQFALQIRYIALGEFRYAKITNLRARLCVF